MEEIPPESFRGKTAEELAAEVREYFAKELGDAEPHPG
jgi:hypothetical protein